MSYLSSYLSRCCQGLRVCKQPSVKLLGKILVLYLSSQISCLLSDELLINNYHYVGAIYTVHADRHLKRLDNHSQHSVEQIGSDCTGSEHQFFKKFPGGHAPGPP